MCCGRASSRRLSCSARQVWVRQDSWSSTSCCARFRLCWSPEPDSLARRNGRRAVFGQQVRCILLLLGNLFHLSRQGLRRLALTAVRSESEAAI